MSRKLVLRSSGIIILVVVSLIGLPWLTSAGILSTCPLSQANAQDNSCLEQEATISALEVEVLQVQATNMALQSTVTSYASTNSVATEVNGSQNSGSLFFDTFRDNSRGWMLTANDYGAARISQGQLRLSANPDEVFILPFPVALSVDQFYIQLDATPGWDCGGWFGIGLTDPTQSVSDQIFYIGTDAGGLCASDRNVRFDVGRNHQFQTRYERGSFWAGDNQTITLGLEFQGGLLSLYINGEQIESINISDYGTYLALAVQSSSPYYESSTAFDNIELRQTR